MEANNKESFSWKKRAKSFVYAAKGIKWLFAEHNAWIHLTATITVVIAGFYFEISKMEWIVVCFCIGLVFAAETFNTAIAKLADATSPEWSEKIGKVKDLAAASVLITAIMAAIIGSLVFIPYLC